MNVKVAKPLERLAWICLIMILSGGTAYALDGKNTVFSDDIVNGQVRSIDVANDTTGPPSGVLI